MPKPHHHPQGTTYERIYAVVRRIPSGAVATYGQVARLAGLPRHARQVGYALNALPDGSDLPWHRVVNAGGKISQRAEPHFEGIQRDLLEREGIVFSPSGAIPLSRYQWDPPHDPMGLGPPGFGPWEP
ncbi:MAG: MGMT family protein [Gammaproteobacteria bacterium]|nr:MGMT family protein [Gammaproteobacteria bacterium]